MWVLGMRVRVSYWERRRGEGEAEGQRSASERTRREKGGRSTDFQSSNDRIVHPFEVGHRILERVGSFDEEAVDNLGRRNGGGDGSSPDFLFNLVVLNEVDDLFDSRVVHSVLHRRIEQETAEGRGSATRLRIDDERTRDTRRASTQPSPKTDLLFMKPPIRNAPHQIIQPLPLNHPIQHALVLLRINPPSIHPLRHPQHIPQRQRSLLDLHPVLSEKVDEPGSVVLGLDLSVVEDHGDRVGSCWPGDGVEVLMRARSGADGGKEIVVVVLLFLMGVVRVLVKGEDGGVGFQGGETTGGVLDESGGTSFA